jgi:hypothetical protein
MTIAGLSWIGPTLITGVERVLGIHEATNADTLGTSSRRIWPLQRRVGLCDSAAGSVGEVGSAPARDARLATPNREVA